jgi:iron complex outermembrane receptor protein
MDEHRRGFINQFGSRGALKRDQDDEVWSADVFAIGEWTLGPRWVLTGGARHSRVEFESRDHFVDPGNPDDSGSVRYSGNSVALGALYKLSDEVHLYANAGTGFETPTLTELAYRPDGSSGLNFDLEPSRSKQIEAGVKANLRAGQRVRATAFAIDTDDEIVVDSASGGRTTFRNAGGTRRLGLEASWEAVFASGIEAYAAWTWIDATYRDSFTSGSPPRRIPAGNRLPGVPKSVLHADIVWRDAGSGFYTGLEARRVGKIPVDDLNSEFADRYTTVSARMGFEQRGARWRMKEFVRVDNLTDERYAGSIIVADGNRRFYEPAPERNYLVGVEASFAF